MSEYDETIQRVTETLKEPVQIDPGLNARVMAEVRRLPQHGHTGPTLGSIWSWLRRPRTVRLSPVGGLAGAMALSLVVFLTTRAFDAAPSSQVALDVAPANMAQMQFVLVAPEASNVSLVGDFNDWDVGSTPMVRGGGDGVWSVTVPLEPGRYRYSFLVDGTTWLRDPQAARTVEDEFGRPNSVLTIGGV